MINQFQRTIVFAMVTMFASSSLEGQTFDIVELPVSTLSTSNGEFINQLGHVFGRRTERTIEGRGVGRAFLWNGSRAIDFGTPGASTQPLGLNDLDHVIGIDESLPERFFFWDGQVVFPLSFRPRDLNNLDQVVGELSGAAVVWSPHQGLRVLEMPAGTINAKASFINERGNVAGEFLVFLNSEFSNRAFLWNEQTGVIDLGPTHEVTGLNDCDQLIGETSSDQLPYRTDVTISNDGTVSVNQIILDVPLGSSGNPLFGSVENINNAGQSVGSASGIAIFWDSDGSYVLSERTVTGSPVSLNDSGYVTHASRNFSTNVFETVFWNPTKGHLVSLPSLGGNSTASFALNEQNQITGFSTGTDGQRAVLWQPTGSIPVGSEAILAIQQTLRELLASEQISEGDFAALMAKLTGADAQLRAGNAQAAIAVLKSAQNQIEQLVFNGFISISVGLELIDAIEDILITL